MENVLREEIPQNKLEMYGKNALSDFDIVASILGSGKNPKWHQVARKIISHCGGIHNIKKYSYGEISSIAGITRERAMLLTMVCEFAKRADSREQSENIQIVTGSRSVYSLLYAEFAGLKVEHFWVVFLNKKNGIIGKKLIASGGTDAVIADSKVIYKEAISNGASSIIVAHNHPSGTLRPSQGDIDVTRKLKATGEAIGIPLLDHTIITDNGYYSFLDEGLI